jgi:hypothetical protein
MQAGLGKRDQKEREKRKLRSYEAGVPEKKKKQSRYRTREKGRKQGKANACEGNKSTFKHY